MFAHEYGWTIDEFLDTPPSVINLLSQKISKRHKQTMFEQLTVLTLGIKAALVRTLLPKTKDQQRSWRTFANTYADIIKQLRPSVLEETKKKGIDLQTDDFVNLGFKKAD